MLDPATTSRLLSQLRELSRKVDEDAFHDLSERELTVLAELTRGKTNAEIGEILHLSEKTVRYNILIQTLSKVAGVLISMGQQYRSLAMGIRR